MSATCWNCEKKVNLEKNHQCPHCQAQLPRFFTITTLKVDETTTLRPHPDPHKRLEAKLATQFRKWLIKELAPYPAKPPPPSLPRIEPIKPGVSIAGMIHHVYIIDARDVFVVDEQFWKAPVNEEWIMTFVDRIKSAQNTLIEEFNHTKLIGKPLGRGVVILCADSQSDDDTLREKLDRVRYEFLRVISDEVEYADFIDKVSDYVTTTVRIVIIGYSGVGKDDLVTLLRGEKLPTSDLPFSEIGYQHFMESRIGTLEITISDYSGHKHFIKCWKFYFSGSRVFIIVTDSTLENVRKTKDLIDLIRRKEIPIGFIVVANKQEYPGALPPKLIEQILETKTIGITEASLKQYNPDLAIKILSEALTQPPFKYPITTNEKPEMTF